MKIFRERQVGFFVIYPALESVLFQKIILVVFIGKKNFEGKTAIKNGQNYKLKINSYTAQLFDNPNLIALFQQSRPYA